jgi:hypothetical protein
MAKKRAANGYQFLPISEAALLLGVNRLRLREAIVKGLVKAQRDNEGRYRVDLTSAPDDLEKAMAQSPTEPSALIDALFDEVEEMQLQIDERDGHLDRMQSLIERQDGVLHRSIELLEKYRDVVARGSGASTPEALAGVSERAMSMLDEVTGKLESTLAENERYRGLVARAVSFSEEWSKATDARAERLTDAADRAMNLLERALPEGESKAEAVQKLGGLVDRALAAGQLLEREVGEAREKLQRQEQVVGKVLDISERAVEAAGRQTARRGWLAWLTGRG